MKLKQDISIGHNLKRLRSRSKLSQEELAAKMQLYGCSTTREIYAQMELGRYNIRVSELLVLKKIYQCEFTDFFRDLPSPEMILKSYLASNDDT